MIWTFQMSSLHINFITMLTEDLAPYGAKSSEDAVLMKKLDNCINNFLSIKVFEFLSDNIFQNDLGHDDVFKWKHFPCYWPFVQGIHQSPVNSPHKGQWRGALMFTLICARINGRGWWFETQSCPLWRRRNEILDDASTWIINVFVLMPIVNKLKAFSAQQFSWQIPMTPPLM